MQNHVKGAQQATQESGVPCRHRASDTDTDPWSSQAGLPLYIPCSQETWAYADSFALRQECSLLTIKSIIGAQWGKIILRLFGDAPLLQLRHRPFRLAINHSATEGFVQESWGKQHGSAPYLVFAPTVSLQKFYMPSAPPTQRVNASQSFYYYYPPKTTRKLL